MRESFQTWKPDTCGCVLHEVKIHTVSETAQSLRELRETLSKLKALVIVERSKGTPDQAKVDQLMARVPETQAAIDAIGAFNLVEKVEVDEARTTILWACPTHADIPHDELHGIVRGENRRKNQALALALKYSDKGDEVTWSFDGSGRDRIVHLYILSMSDNNRVSAKSRIASAFGSEKVVID